MKKKTVGFVYVCESEGVLDFFFFFKGHTWNVSCDTLGLLHSCCEEQFVTQCVDFGDVASGNLHIRFQLTKYLLHFWQIETINPRTSHGGGCLMRLITT